MVATTIVSSTLLSKIAQHYGAEYAETLTGFKWIANRAIEHDAGGGEFVLGYEEALGYSPGSLVRDKDGVSTLLLFVDFVAWCKREGTNPLGELAEIHRRHGVHVSQQVAMKFEGADGGEKIDSIMEKVRSDLPSSLGGEEVVALSDLAAGTRQNLVSQTLTKLELPLSNVLGIDLSNGDRVLVRPSGTEPKIKFYFEVVIPFEAGFAAATLAGKRRISMLIEELSRVTGIELS
jgi:phosphomannomutase